jgi:methyl-accepting chemotaxis protein
MTTNTPSSRDHYTIEESNVKKVSVAWRLSALGALPVVILVVFSIWMWLSLSDADQALTQDVQKNTTWALQAKDLQRHVIQVQQFLTDVSATQGLNGLDDGFEIAKEHQAAFNDILAGFEKAQAAGEVDVEAGQLKTLRRNFDAYYAAGVVMAQAYVAGGPATGNPLMKPFDEASTALQDEVGPFVQRFEARLLKGESAVAGSVHLLKISAVAVTVLAAVLVGLFGWWVTLSICRPVMGALRAVKKIVDGDLTSPLKSTRRDEIGDLVREMERMRMRFLLPIRDLRHAANNIGTAAIEIANGNQDLSTRTEQTASNLQRTAASMEQLTSTVRQSADSAKQANQLVASASQFAVRGGDVVGQVVTTMEEINHSSKKINDIIGVIDGIAFQTNILALNAAVEAARAGEQGRGFAVVASEVRSLAQRSAEAAKEIKGLIGTSVDKVDAGSRLVAEAGQTMSEIVGSVQRVSDIMGEIASAAGEQSDGIAQVNSAINELDQMTQQNAALVEQSAAAADSLRDQAEHLSGAVKVFRLG